MPFIKDIGTQTGIEPMSAILVRYLNQGSGHSKRHIQIDDLQFNKQNRMNSLSPTMTVRLDREFDRPWGSLEWRRKLNGVNGKGLERLPPSISPSSPAAWSRALGIYGQRNWRSSIGVKWTGKLGCVWPYVRFDSVRSIALNQTNRNRRWWGWWDLISTCNYKR